MQNPIPSASTLPTVSEMVRTDYRTADVFRKWGINYCCGGNLPLAQACELKGVDLAALEADLAKATTTVSLPNALQFDAWPLIFLVDYIVHVHHGYLKNVLSPLTASIHSFVSGHAKKYPYLVGVEETVSALAVQLQEEMQREEESLFPYLRQLVHASERKESYGPLFVRTMRKPLADAVKEGQRSAALLQALRRQTANYHFAAEACTAHQVIYHKLKELDADLVQHKHLENNLLFPKALQIEQSLLGV